MYVSASKEIEQQNFNIETTGKILKNTQTSFSKAMSNTLGNFSKGLMDLSNMFNLDKLASINNSGLNKFVNDKLSVQNEMMKQFGFETKNQYINFKNGLDSTLASMGSLYNGSDLRNYMSQMSSLGITDTKMAQDQMRASIMGTKYLGVSAETQTEMFKWMKRTNDYKMLDDHNKVITGLLKSQLGVSKEQLDTLTQVAYGSNNSMAAMGMSNEAISAVNDASLIVGHSLMGAGLDAQTAAGLQKAYQDFITADINSLGGYAALGVTDAYGLQNAMRNTTNSAAQVELASSFFSQMLNSNALSGNDTQINQSIQSRFPALNIDQLAGLRGLDFSKFSQNTALDLSNIDQTLANAKADELFVQETTEITWLENIYNRLDKFFSSLDTAGIMSLVSLANLAFTAMVGSKMFDIYDKLSNLGLANKLDTASTAISKLGTVGSGILATGGGILLSASAISAISHIADSWVNKASGVTEDDLNHALGGMSGTSFERDSTYASVLAQSTKSSSSSKFKGILGTVANVGSGFMNNLNKGNPVLYNTEYWENFERSRLGLWDADTWLTLRYLYALIMDKVGTPSVSKDLFGIDNAALKRYINNTPLVADRFNQAYKLLHNPTDSLNFMGLPIDYNGVEFDGNLSIDGYHKAGLSYVPKENYRALLHKGEMVLSADEANAIRKGYGTGGYEAIPWPITSRYNTMSKIRSGYHTGTDFGAPMGTPVGAAIGGEIIQKSWGGAFGNHIIIRGDNGLYYLYAHLSRKAVEGGRVNTGQTIGYVGSTGNSTGPHLHFEVQRSSSWARGNELDPAPYVTAGLLGDGSAITPTVEEAYGTPAGNLQTADGSTSSMASSNAIPIRTKRFIPSSMNSTSYGHGGADRIVNSVNGGFGKLMNYLDDIRKEQDLQKEMINTFSRTNTEGVI